MKKWDNTVPKITESTIRKQVRDFLILNNWTVLYHLQGLGCFKGLSDLQALKDGRSVFVEIKQQNGKQSDVQKEFQRLVEKAGFEYVIARSINDVLHLTDVRGQMRMY